MNGMKIVNQWVVLSGISIARFADFIASRRYLGWVPIASLAPLGETLASRTKKTKKMRIVTKNRWSSESRTIVRREFDELSFMSPVISPLRRLMHGRKSNYRLGLSRVASHRSKSVSFRSARNAA